MIYVSAFDLDHTLVQANTGLLFYKYLIKRGILHRFSLLKAFFYTMQHYTFGVGLQELHEKVFRRFLKGRSLQFVEQEVAEFLKKDFFEFLYQPALARLRRAQHEGHYTVILSNSPSFIVGPIAAYLGVSSWSSSRYQVDKNGKLSGVDTILLGDGKAEYLRKLGQKFKITKEKITAYSDSILDLPFLAAAGKAIVVNPDTKMEKIAEENLWEVI